MYYEKKKCMAVSSIASGMLWMFPSHCSVKGTSRKMGMKQLVSSGLQLASTCVGGG
jgi:hypothetical protein